MNDVDENRMEESSETVTRFSCSVFVGIIFNGNEKELKTTIQSVLKQSSSQSDVCVFFQEQEKLPELGVQNLRGIPFRTKADFFRKLVEAIEQCSADYCTVINCDEVFFEGAFDSVDRIFNQYSNINWLTGIQTFRAQNGFSLSLGSTALRRWSLKLYERNLYKNTGRFIAPASTFWRKRIWGVASKDLHFVGQSDFCEDLWIAFFRTQKLYTCKIYFSNSSGYDWVNKAGLNKPYGQANIEDRFWEKAKEFFFINNVPYLRWLYRTESKLTPLVRFDHNTQSYFLSDY